MNEPSVQKRALAERFASLLEARLGERLVSVVLYGSVARGEARPDSDVDLFVVAHDLPRVLRRYDVWKPVNDALGHPGFSVLVRTPDEAAPTRPLYLDMTEDAVLLLDRGDFFKGILDRLRARMRELGSVRRRWKGFVYWELKPGMKLGEEIEL